MVVLNITLGVLQFYHTYFDDPKNLYWCFVSSLCHERKLHNCPIVGTTIIHETLKTHVYIMHNIICVTLRGRINSCCQVLHVAWVLLTGQVQKSCPRLEIVDSPTGVHLRNFRCKSLLVCFSGLLKRSETGDLRPFFLRLSDKGFLYFFTGGVMFPNAKISSIIRVSIGHDQVYS